jgi:hypothetical protein
MNRRKRNGIRVATAGLLVALTATGLIVASGFAASSARPTNQDPPTISGKAEVGQTLSASTGRWANTPTAYDYDWRRCDSNGGSCSSITGANTKDYVLKTVDKDNTLRVRVTARNADGSANATSVPTGVVAAAPATTTTGTTTTTPSTGSCTGQGASVPVADVAPPERLTIDRQSIQPGVVGGSTQTLTVRFHVAACSGKSVQGALVYVTAVPYNQFSVPAEVQTGADGWAQLDMRRLSGYPASSRQRLLVMFARARKNGENLLGGISTRRLVSFPVNLRQ